MGSNKSGIYKLKGVIRNYDWGGADFLSNLLSHPNPFKQPMAEYWLGAHESSPSLLETSQGNVELNKFISNDTERILGKTVVKKLGRLPYLLKLLDVKDMLSIQVHPSKHTAEVEFERENAEGIPLNAVNRNYRDNNHKPELVVSLNKFWLIHGFKPVGKLRGTLQSIPELKPLLDIFDETGYDQLYKTVMEMPQQSVNGLLQPLLDRIIPLYQQNELTKDQEDFWAARAALAFNQTDKIDRGIFSIYFFNLLHLKKREGIFQDAGVPHAYLEGQNVEIMANSDNVLRGGLTSKHINVKELMRNIKFEETIPQILHPQKIDHEKVYRTAAADFKLSHFEFKKGDNSILDSATAEILLVIDGNLSIASGVDKLELNKGEAAFIISGQQVILNVLSETDLYRASVPAHHTE
jgi:mannose-6-phosphate isomerase